MTQWIFKIAEKDKYELGSIRCFPGLSAAIHKDWIWLKGHFPSGKPGAEILQLPIIETYILDAEYNLFLQAALTPVGRLPEMEWKNLTALLPLEIPATALPGRVGEWHQIQIVPSEKPSRGEALLTNWETWKDYAIEAPAVRLNQLQFAVSNKQQVLVLGTPLPSIPGKEFWLQHHNLLPCGFDFKIPLVAALLAHKLNPDRDAYLRFNRAGQWQKIPKRDFVKASRSAVRLTDHQLL